MKTIKPATCLLLCLFLTVLCYQKQPWGKQSPVDTPQPNATLGSKWSFNEVSNHVKDQASQQAGGNPALIQFPGFDIDYVYEKLKQVELDNQNNIKLNDKTRAALDATLNVPNLVLSELDLSWLSETIQIALPGDVGTQASKIILDYYDYLQSKDQLLGDMSHPTTIEGQQELLSMDKALRTHIFGETVAKQLFSKQEYTSQFMLESLTVAQNDALSREEKEQKIDHLRDKYYQNSPPIDDWKNKYASYLEQQNIIYQQGLASALSTTALQNNYQSLMEQLFSEQEIDTLSEYGYDLMQPPNE